MPYFENSIPVPADPIFGVSQAYKDCQSPQKVDLVIGAYRDDNGKPCVFKYVYHNHSNPTFFLHH